MERKKTFFVMLFEGVIYSSNKGYKHVVILLYFHIVIQIYNKKILVYISIYKFSSCSVPQKLIFLCFLLVSGKIFKAEKTRHTSIKFKKKINLNRAPVNSNSKSFRESSYLIRRE